MSTIRSFMPVNGASNTGEKVNLKQALLIEKLKAAVTPTIEKPDAAQTSLINRLKIAIKPAETENQASAADSPNSVENIFKKTEADLKKNGYEKTVLEDANHGNGIRGGIKYTKFNQPNKPGPYSTFFNKLYIPENKEFIKIFSESYIAGYDVSPPYPRNFKIKPKDDGTFVVTLMKKDGFSWSIGEGESKKYISYQ